MSGRFDTISDNLLIAPLGTFRRNAGDSAFEAASAIRGVLTNSQGGEILNFHRPFQYPDLFWHHFVAKVSNGFPADGMVRGAVNMAVNNFGTKQGVQILYPFDGRSGLTYVRYALVDSSWQPWAVVGDYQEKVLTAQQVTTSTTFAITPLGFDVITQPNGSKFYHFEAYLRATTSAITNVPRFAWYSDPTSGTQTTHVIFSTPSSTTANIVLSASPSVSANAAGSWPLANTALLTKIEGIVDSSSVDVASGLSVNMASEVAGATSTLLPGSFIRWRRLIS